MQEADPLYNEIKRGKLIAWGGDHLVYNYGEDQVVKISLVEFMMGDKGEAKIKRDYEICKQFFGEKILDTIINKPLGKRLSRAIQPKVRGKYLCQGDLSDPVINKQFREVVIAHDKLMVAGHKQIDFVGSLGVLSGSMSNIFIQPDRRLIIIDATLCEFSCSTLFNPFLYLIASLARWKNNLVLKKFDLFSQKNNL